MRLQDCYSTSYIKAVRFCPSSYLGSYGEPGYETTTQVFQVGVSQNVLNVDRFL